MKWADERQKQIAAQQLAEEARQARLKEEAEQEADDGTEEEEEEEEVWHLQPKVPVPASVEKPPVPKPIMPVISKDILTPIPIHKPEENNASENTENSADANGKIESSVDVAMFENVDDPFEKFERQTLNDIEELKNVFATTDNSGADLKTNEKTDDAEEQDVTGSDVVENLYENTKMSNGYVPNGIVNSVLPSLGEDGGDYVAIDVQAKVSPKPKRKSNVDLSNLPPIPPRPSLTAKNPLPPIGRVSPSDTNTAGVADPVPINPVVNSHHLQPDPSSQQPMQLVQEMFTPKSAANEPPYNNTFNSDVYQNVSVDDNLSSVAFCKGPSSSNAGFESETSDLGVSPKQRRSDYVNVAPRPAIPPRAGDGLMRRGPGSSPDICTATNSVADDSLPVSLSRTPPPLPSSRQVWLAYSV